MTPKNRDIRSSLLGYSSRPWVAVSETCVALILGNDRTVAFMDLVTGEWEERVFAPGAVLGSICALDGDAVLVADYGPTRERHIVRVSRSHDAWRVVTQTSSLVADLTASSTTNRVAWLDWRNTSMPWEQCRIVILTLDDTYNREELTQKHHAYAQPFFDGDDLLYSEEIDEWFVPRRRGGSNETIFPAGEFRPDWMLGRHWMAPTPEGVVSIYVHESVTRLGIWRPDGRFDAFEGCPVAVRDVYKRQRFTAQRDHGAGDTHCRQRVKRERREDVGYGIDLREVRGSAAHVDGKRQSRRFERGTRIEWWTFFSAGVH